MDNQIKQSNTLFAGFRPCHIYDGRAAIFHRWVDEANTIPASPFVGGAPAGQFHTGCRSQTCRRAGRRNRMPVLIACEESQTECMAFRALGIEAYSCDIQEPSGGHPEWHILGDALEAMRGGQITTMDGQMHDIHGWDLMIAHPPCTYLSNAGAARLYKRIDGESYVRLKRLEKGLDAREFFMKFLEADIPKIAVENPIPSGVYRLPKYDQIIQPYEFGHPYSKKTCLWLKGLPKLMATDIVEPVCSWVSGGSKKADGSKRDNQGTTFRDSKKRSKSFSGIARAMAEQWGRYAT